MLRVPRECVAGAARESRAADCLETVFAAITDSALGRIGGLCGCGWCRCDHKAFGAEECGNARHCEGAFFGHQRCVARRRLENRPYGEASAEAGFGCAARAREAAQGGGAEFKSPGGQRRESWNR